MVQGAAEDLTARVRWPRVAAKLARETRAGAVLSLQEVSQVRGGTPLEGKYSVVSDRDLREEMSATA